MTRTQHKRTSTVTLWALALLVWSGCVSTSLAFTVSRRASSESRAHTIARRRLDTPVDLLACPTTTTTATPLRVATALRMSNNNNNNNDNNDLLTTFQGPLSCLPYLLPLLDGDEFGKFVYMRIPALGFADRLLLGPLANLYHSIPFLGLGVFVLISSGTRNPEIPRNIRFNAQQALLIDIALIFPSIVGQSTGGLGIPRVVVEPATNFVYYAFIACIIYSVSANLSGNKPDRIPIISDAAETGIGPV